MKKVLSFFLIIFSAIFAHSLYIAHFSGKSLEATVFEAFSNMFEGEFYEALANPTVSYVKIVEGSRKEEIASKLSARFNWTQTDVEDFYAYDNIRDRKFEGKYFPDTYIVPRDVSGKEMRNLMTDRFNKKIAELKKQAEKKNLNFDSVLIMASIIQREAAGKQDMKLISGVMWNRIFSGMKLQMDATLQYAKATENNWWPKVIPEDKTITSPYNTYRNNGLPPAPISNPGLLAIEAVINPTKTSCYFYFHKNRQIYCSKTYEEHKQKIDTYLIKK